MIKNYLKIAWRNLVRHKSYSVINITGLAVGIAASLLIFVVVKYELSYDKFQQNYDRVYRIVTAAKNGDGSEGHNPGIPAPAYEALKTDFPQFEKIAAVSATTGNQITVLGNDPNSDVAVSKKFIEPTTLAFTHSEYFDMFQVKWIAGNAKSLEKPNNAVIVRPTAVKYFGDVKNAIINYLKMDNT